MADLRVASQRVDMSEPINVCCVRGGWAYLIVGRTLGRLGASDLTVSSDCSGRLELM